MFPKFVASMASFDLAVPVPRSRAPVSVEFRTGADLADVVGKLRSSRNVAVNAAPGSGKSTVLPFELARSVDEVVLLVLPFMQAAAVMHDYLITKAMGVPVEYVDDVQQPYPESGLCVTSAAQVVARWLQAGKAVLPPCYVLHDESHESGAASATMRLLMPSMRGIKCYATMSATSGLEKARAMETGGVVHQQEYMPDAFEDPWSVEEDGAPWSAFDLDGHILIFEDDKARAQSLMQAYNYNGVSAFRLHSGSPVKDVLNVCRRLYNEDFSECCALIVDSTYRSGYTFPVSVIVDSGFVRRTVLVDGMAKVVSRSIYENERVQSSCRGGRLQGLQTVYWRPQCQLENVLCDLEQTDVEALALICRILGFRPPVYAAQAVMATGPVPRDVCSAVRGHLPLAALPVQSLVEVAVGKLEVEVEEPVVRAQAVQDVRRVSHGVVSDSVKSVEVQDREVVAESEAVGENPHDVLAAIFSKLDVKRDSVSLGQFCAVEGSVTSDTRCTAFPAGVDSVFRVLARGPRAVVHASWSDYHRGVALNAMVNSHNVDLIQWRAWMSVLRHANAKTVSKDPVALKAWAVRCAEEATRLAARVESTLAIVLEVADGYVDIVPCDGMFSAEEARLSQALRQGFEAVASVDSSRVVREKNRVSGWLDETVKRHEGEHARLAQVDSGGTDSRVKRLPGWLAYTSGYTGNSRPRVERISVSGSESSSGSSGRRQLSFVR